MSTLGPYSQIKYSAETNTLAYFRRSFRDERKKFCNIETRRRILRRIIHLIFLQKANYQNLKFHCHILNIHSGAGTIKLFKTVINSISEKTSLIFADKVGAYPSKAPYGTH